jgi:hypothetical protein
MTDQMPSWFLQEIPRDTIAHENCSYWKTVEFKDYFSKWFNMQNSFSASYSSGSIVTFGSAKSKTPSESVPKKSIIASGTAPKSFKILSTENTSKAPVIAPSFKASTSAPFKIRQSVKHEKFGIGLVTEIEEKLNEVFFVTVSFKTGKKKLDSKFLQKV